MSISRECFRCGYQWEQRGFATPRQCPYCKSPKWALARAVRPAKVGDVMGAVAAVAKRPIELTTARELTYEPE